MKELRNRVIAVTGAASGIGEALAVELARQGARLALSDVDEDGLDRTADQCESFGAEVYRARVDVADREAMHDWAETVAARFGAVHGIVNNAGVSLRATVEDMEYADFEWLMGINFWGVVHGTKAFLPHLRAADEGHVVNISSVFGIMGIPTQSAYNAAKFAVRGFTESLREEMLAERTNIGVTCVHPGGIKTAIARSGRIKPMSRFRDKANPSADFENVARTTPEDAALAIIDGIVNNRPRVLIGLDAQLIDKTQRIFPTLYQHLVAQIFSRTVEPK